MKNKEEKKRGLSKLKAVEYIVKNGKHHNEWMGAGLFVSIQTIINQKHSAKNI